MFLSCGVFSAVPLGCRWECEVPFARGLCLYQRAEGVFFIEMLCTDRSWDLQYANTQINWLLFWANWGGSSEVPTCAMPFSEVEAKHSSRVYSKKQ